MNNINSINYTTIAIIVVSAFFAMSCQENKEEIIQKEAEVPDQITLLFDKAPVNNKIRFEHGGTIGKSGNYEVRYINDNFIETQEPLRYNEFDTIIINTKRSELEVRLAYKGLDELSYKFKKGDSVLFTYDSLRPWAKVLNRKESDYSVNYELLLRDRITKNDYPEHVKYFSYYHRLVKLKKEERFSEIRLQDQFENERVFLDSLWETGHISTENVAYHKTKRKFLIKKMELAELVGFRIALPPLHDLTAKNFNLEDDPLFIGKENFNKNQVINAVPDSMLNYVFYSDMLRFYLNWYLERKVGRNKSEMLINGKATGGSNLPDYRAVYDLILADTIFEGTAKKMLLFKNMQSLIQESSPSEIEIYMDRFKEDTGDLVMVDYLNEKYSLDIEEIVGQDRMINDSLLLYTKNNEIMAYNKLLESLQGKVVYVDFWATWCRPCLREMPHSKTLNEQYKNDDVAFVYLSIDNDVDNWINGAVKHDLDNLENSYMVANRLTSKLLEKLEFEYIPRYLLYDKQGNLVNDYALRPSDPAIGDLFDKYLED